MCSADIPLRLFRRATQALRHRFQSGIFKRYAVNRQLDAAVGSRCSEGPRIALDAFHPISDSDGASVDDGAVRLWIFCLTPDFRDIWHSPIAAVAPPKALPRLEPAGAITHIGMHDAG
jgi:hypothetical protein